MLTLLLAMVSSHVAEVVTWLNKKLTGTILEGTGAFIVAMLMSFVAALYELYMKNGLHATSWSEIGALSTQIFGLSQIYFKFVVKRYNLDVKRY